MEEAKLIIEGTFEDVDYDMINHVVHVGIDKFVEMARNTDGGVSIGRQTSAIIYNVHGYILVKHPIKNDVQKWSFYKETTDLFSRELTPVEQRTILEEKFGYSLGLNGVIYDDDGNEFYGNDDNDKYDFSTITKIINTVYLKSIEEGKSRKIFEIKKVLDL